MEAIQVPQIPRSEWRAAGDIAPAEVLDASTTVLIAVIDLRGCIVYVNAASRLLLGYEPEELIGLAGDELIPPGLAEEARNAFEGARAGRPRLSQRIFARRRDGSHVDLHFDITPLMAEDGAVAAVVVNAHEVDEGVPAALRALSTAHSLEPEGELIDRLPAVVYVAEPGESGRWRYVSPHIERMLGYSPGEWVSNPSLWADRLHPDDRPRVLEEENRDVASASPIASEYRLLTRDGQIIWVRDEAVLRVDPSGERYYDGLLTDITERKGFESQLQYIADHDSLTGLFNRRRFIAELEVELKRRRRGDEPTTILMVDVDGLKDVNDMMGHHVGDELLRATAQAMATRLRESDTVSRLGGDEFAALLRGADEKHAFAVATELLEAIGAEARRFVPELGGRSASAGVAEIHRDCASPEAVLARADRAMYEAKRKGGGMVEVHPNGEN
jgi:diguanylate cyclase (GGDEF)-like protein/PAS domain S-box-containing protein